MPGFNIGGIGGVGPSNTVEVRRKHRWRFATLGRGVGIGVGSPGPWRPEALLLLQSASRPSFTLEEVEMHHNQEVAYLAGKQTWEPVALMWYDAEQNPDIAGEVYTWINTVVDIASVQVTVPGNYKRQASLEMLDGIGNATETWQMFGTWPTSANWQELDYTSTELQTCEVSMRYDRALRV